MLISIPRPRPTRHYKLGGITSCKKVQKWSSVGTQFTVQQIGIKYTGSVPSTTKTKYI